MEVQTILKDLIQIKSYSGQEDKLASYLIAFANKNGITFEYCEGNVVMKFINNSPKCLLFNAHMDTVRAGDPKLWQHPPFGSNSGVIKNSKLYGLGASDAKASIAAFLLLAVELVQRELSCDVWLVFVTEEETTGSGTKNFLYRFNGRYIKKYKEIAAVLGEPTDLETVEIGHRGNIFVKLTTEGNPGHSAYLNQLDNHAIQKMMEVIDKMNKLNIRVKNEYKDQLFGVPSMTLTDIKCTNESINKIPAACISTWDIRTTPQFHGKALDIIKDELGKKAKIELVGHSIPCSLTDENEKIVSLFKKLVPNLAIKIAPSSNDSYFFNNCGIPAVTFGPGQKEVIHKPNEYVIIDNLIKAANIYHNLIDRFAEY